MDEQRESYMNYGSFDGWARTIGERNTKMLERLREIKRSINSLESSYESNASTEIRRKITNMESRFQQYYDVVDNYAKFLRNTATEYGGVERTNTSNAEQFI